MDSIEESLKELRYIGGAEDPEVWNELRRLIGDFGELGRVGTINLTDPSRVGMINNEQEA